MSTLTPHTQGDPALDLFQSPSPFLDCPHHLRFDPFPGSQYVSGRRLFPTSLDERIQSDVDRILIALWIGEDFSLGNSFIGLGRAYQF